MESENDMNFYSWFKEKYQGLLLKQRSHDAFLLFAGDLARSITNVELIHVCWDMRL